MCLGVPMRVQEVGDGWAVCQGDGAPRRVNTLLLGSCAVDDWVLVHIDNAVRVLEPAEATRIGDALKALDAALNGRSFDHLFADLINREPQLPEVLRAASDEQRKIA